MTYYNTQTQTWTTTPPGSKFTGGVRLGLGAGMPSRPVLDSSGTSIFIQLSTGDMLRKKSGPDN